MPAFGMPRGMPRHAAGDAAAAEEAVEGKVEDAEAEYDSALSVLQQAKETATAAGADDGALLINGEHQSEEIDDGSDVLAADQQAIAAVDATPPADPPRRWLAAPLEHSHLDLPPDFADNYTEPTPQWVAPSPVQSRAQRAVGAGAGRHCLHMLCVCACLCVRLWGGGEAVFFKAADTARRRFVVSGDAVHRQ